MSSPDEKRAPDGAGGENGAAQTDSSPARSSTSASDKASNRSTTGKRLFPWLLPALKNRRTLKTWARCTIVLLAAMILLVDQDTLATMGQAGFFAALVCVMLPPNLALPLWTIAAATLLIGMCLGWAWGIAAMASANNVRSQSRLLAAQQEMIQNNVTQPLDQQIWIFHGYFLDPRSSAVYGAFLFIGAYFMGTIRAHFPKLALLAIFGTIVMDVMCSYGPLLPQTNYTLAKLFVIPASYYVACAIAALILIFPESLNHVWLTSLENNMWQPILDIIALQDEALGKRPSDHSSWQALTGRGRALGGKLDAGVQGLVGQVKLAGVEWSMGRLGPGDLKKISKGLESLAFRATCLLSFQRFVDETNAADARDAELLEKQANSAPGSIPIDRFTLLRRRIKEREAVHGHNLDALMPILAHASEGLRAAVAEAALEAQQWGVECNHGRWSGWFFACFGQRRKLRDKVIDRRAKVGRALGALERELEIFRTVTRKELLKPYEKCFDPETRALKEDIARGGKGHPDMFAVQSLFTCFVFIDTLDAFSERLAMVMRRILLLDPRREMARLWAPAGLGAIARKLFSDDDIGVENANAVVIGLGVDRDPANFDRDWRTSTRASSVRQEGDGATTDGEEESDSEVEEDEGAEVRAREAEKRRKEAARVKAKETKKKEQDSPKRVQRECLLVCRNPDALPPTSTMGRIGMRFARIIRGMKSDNGVFAFKYALVSVALWIPQVCFSSAWLTYKEKGLWALIMAQTGLSVYAGDQIGGYVIRLIGTGIGLLLGMAVWYIGAGNGDGNPYGIVAATVVFISPFLLARIAVPPQDMIIYMMTGVTAVFVVGFSWVDTHILAQPANAGIGVELGWKRALLVIIGFTAGFIVMLFPSPTSARLLVRRTLAATFQELGSVFAAEMETFLAEEARYQRTLKGFDSPSSEVAAPSGDDPDRPAYRFLNSNKEAKIRKLGDRILGVQTRLQALAPSLKTARWEPQVQGMWPHTQYEKLYANQMKLLSSIVLLVGTMSRLDPKWCSVLVHRTPFLNPNLLADAFSTIAILSQSLTTAQPIPGVLPRIRDRMVYHERHKEAYGAHARGIHPRVQESRPQTGTEENVEELDFSGGKVDGSTIGFEQLTLDVLLDDQLPAHCTAVLALSSIVGLLDENANIVRELCGETRLAGIEYLRDQYLSREENTIASDFAARMQNLKAPPL
ncbi:hypothetical protein K523DRAFT_344860 [Schizophyllum commune Tattone D]|nr:hypothetical protein K523DRAFT_344860 [Schizophyllum commune Tattone D]